MAMFHGGLHCACGSGIQINGRANAKTWLRPLATERFSAVLMHPFSRFFPARFLPGSLNERSFYYLNDSGVEVDAAQFILLMSAHTERHTAQIEEVKADPKFPAR